MRQSGILNSVGGSLLLSLALVFLVMLPGAAQAAFPDVPETHPYADSIERLAVEGIISGHTDGRFGPADPAKRAQFAKMITGTLALSVGDSLYPFGYSISVIGTRAGG